MIPTGYNANASVPGKRKRRAVLKSFSGCVECKTRKIKCDETKPACLRCTHRGAQCSGFSRIPNLRWSQKHERCAQETRISSGIDDILVNHSPSPNKTPSLPGQSFGFQYSKVIADVQRCSQRSSNRRRSYLLDGQTQQNATTHSGVRDQVKVMAGSDEQEQGILSSQGEIDSMLPVPLHEQAIPTSLTHLSSILVTAYFQLVCPLFSAFDSDLNHFRSFVGRKWQSSSSMFYTILSMSAAKLAREDPAMGLHALQSRQAAISNLRGEILTRSQWDVELLFVVLMLGLSTCWHNLTDLGIIHLRGFQQALASGFDCSSEDLEFFQQSLVYWEMVVSLVDDSISLHDYSSSSRRANNPRSQNQYKSLSIRPHPWTGIASQQQAIFSQIIRHVRRARPWHEVFEPMVSVHPDFFNESVSVSMLEEELWRMKIPSLHEIASTGDENTPSIHHLLIAEAYMYANLYHIYHSFPTILNRRIAEIRSGAGASLLTPESWARQQEHDWSAILNSGWGEQEFLKFLGWNIILRVQQIPISSRTMSLHPLLLLVASGTLSTNPVLQGIDIAAQVNEMRGFVLHRFTELRNAFIYGPICCIEKVIEEVFRQLDAGLQVFWLDVLHTMGISTLIV